MEKVVGMHFVCRDDLNVVDHGDGTFDTGVWAVAAKHCSGLEYVALHQSKRQRSYRQGQVLKWRMVWYEGRKRIVFTVRDDGRPREWQGEGAGEKGFVRR